MSSLIRKETLAVSRPIIPAAVKQLYASIILAASSLGVEDDVNISKLSMTLTK